MATKGPKSTKTVAKPEPVSAPVSTVASGAATKTAKPVAPKISKPVAAPKVAAKPASAMPVTAAAPIAAPLVETALVAERVAVAAPEAVVEPVAVEPIVAAPAPIVHVTPEITPEVTPEITPAAPVAPAAVAPLHTSKKATIMETTLHTATEKTQALFGDMNERTKAAMEKSTQLFADMNEFSKGNVEALVESSKIAVKGIETMSHEAADYTRKTFEGATAAMRDMAAVKTPADFMKLQSEFVRTAFDSLVAETSKNTEAMLKLAGEVAQPISNRVAVAAEKIKVTA